MAEQPREYYARRAHEERVAAQSAPDERAAQSHRELAAHYEKVAAGEEEPSSSRGDRSRLPAGGSPFRIVP
jgi:hypothetical protein